MRTANFLVPGGPANLRKGEKREKGKAGSDTEGKRRGKGAAVLPHYHRRREIRGGGKGWEGGRGGGGGKRNRLTSHRIFLQKKGKREKAAQIDKGDGKKW